MRAHRLRPALPQEREGIDPEQLQAFYRGKVMSSVDEQKLSTLQHSTHVTLVAPPCVKAGQPGAPLPRDRPAAALPFVSAMAVPGREGAVEQIYVPPPDEPSARIGFRTLTGQNIDVPVPLDRPFGWIKMRILEVRWPSLPAVAPLWLSLTRRAPPLPSLPPARTPRVPHRPRRWSLYTTVPRCETSRSRVSWACAVRRCCTWVGSWCVVAGGRGTLWLTRAPTGTQRTG